MRVIKSAIVCTSGLHLAQHRIAHNADLSARAANAFNNKHTHHDPLEQSRQCQDLNNHAVPPLPSGQRQPRRPKLPAIPHPQIYRLIALDAKRHEPLDVPSSHFFCFFL
jgi:hypothetical protein